jgi:UDP-N-acetylmuramoylalanine--D-glutamate ligase
MIGSFVMIVGGSDKGEDYSQFQVDGKVIATGANAEKFKDAEVVESLEKALAKAIELKPQNILFSPASASFDRYKNYIERGEYFFQCCKRYLDLI